MTENWLIPFKGRLDSGAQKCNLLYRADRLYIMDNHRLALWAWFQHFDPAITYNFFHIDAHYDCDPIISENWNHKVDLKNLTLNDYVNFPTEKIGQLFFRWDNYVPILLNQNRQNLNIRYAATHGLGIKGNFDHEFMPWDLLKYVENRFFDHDHWIINLDLDYFFAREFKETPLFHPTYMRKIFKAFKSAYDDGLIDIMTVALSPECCGGWEKAEEVLALFNQEFRLKITL